MSAWCDPFSPGRRSCYRAGGRGGKITEIWAPPADYGSNMGVSYKATPTGLKGIVSGRPQRIVLKPIETLALEL